MSTFKRPLVLTILDGWGYRAETANNAIALAKKPTYDKLLREFPNTLIQASDHFVGLPDGQMGNSEVGHLNIGAGRIVQMDITRIDAAIASGEFEKNPAIVTCALRPPAHRDEGCRGGEENVATTIITEIEILLGRYDFLLKAADGPQLMRAQQWLDESIALFQEIAIIPISSATAAEFDRIRQNKKLRTIGRRDMLIACIALASQATLATRNLKDFRQIPGLRLENWAD